MAAQFRISPQMTKKEIIEKYTSLLDAYKAEAQKAKETEKWQSEAEKYKEAMALQETQEATVESVTENVGKLKAQIKDTLNDLTEKLTSEAERLEQINMAVSLQEKRLKELYNLEEVSDALSKLTAAYEDRKNAAENEYALRIKQLEDEYEGKRQALEKEINESRAQWEEERNQSEKELKEKKLLAKKAWEREEAEYIYERDRERKLEEDEYNEKKAALEKELRERKEAFEKEITSREDSIRAREAEYEELKKKASEFPSILKTEVAEAKKQTAFEVKKEMDQQIKILTTESNWQKKVFEQKIKFLEEAAESQEAKITELKTEVAGAMNHVHKIAEKAVEGASQVKAFQSVKEIALEQAKSPSQGKEE